MIWELNLAAPEAKLQREVASFHPAMIWRAIMGMRSRAHKCIADNGDRFEHYVIFNIHLSCSKRKFVQMQLARGNRKGVNLHDSFFMCYIVENLGIKNSEAD